MTDENPYSPPLINDPSARPKRRHVGPILGGLIAIGLVTIFTRGGGLLIAVLGVGSWWAYKLWPKKPAPEDAEARKFLQNLEHAPTIIDDSSKAAESTPAEQPLDGLRDLRY